MGSYWAYYTLGWGGFWFWDPVENASLMPWLAGTAFLHSVAVMEKRDALKVWTIFLAILAFSFSLLGTFLVRSGVLTSVHAFASDPQARRVHPGDPRASSSPARSALFAWRAPMLKQGGLFAPISREGALVLNNLLLTTACASGAGRHALSARAGATDRRKDHGRRAVLQHDRRRAAAGADVPDAVRLLAGLEARRSARRRAAARASRSPAASSRWSRCSRSPRRPGAGADRGGAGDFRHARRAHRSCRARPARRARRRPSRCSARAGCRCRSGAARWRISASACCCSASPRPASARRRSWRCGRRAGRGRPLRGHLRHGRLSAAARTIRRPSRI